MTALSVPAARMPVMTPLLLTDIGTEGIVVPRPPELVRLRQEYELLRAGVLEKPGWHTAGREPAGS